MNYFRRGHKFNAKRVDISGHSFASQLEAALWQRLELERRAGEWSDVKCQVQVELTKAAIIYKPDFATVDAETGETVYHEAKGVETPVWRLKRKLWFFYGPGVLRVWKGSAARLVLHETIIPRTSDDQELANV